LERDAAALKLIFAAQKRLKRMVSVWEKWKAIYTRGFGFFLCQQAQWVSFIADF